MKQEKKQSLHRNGWRKIGAVVLIIALFASLMAIPGGFLGYSPILANAEEETTYTISFDANGGENAPATQIKTHGVDLILTEDIPTRTGYRFFGWALSKEAADQGVLSYKPGYTVYVNENRTLYASWILCKYDITYDAYGGINAPAAQKKIHFQDLVLSANVPQREGYDFAGWATSQENADKGVVSYQPGDTFTNNQTKTLYAVWNIRTFTVEYNANGGEGAPESLTRNYGEEITIPDTIPTRQGYKFYGWALSQESADNAVLSYKPGFQLTVNANRTLYAVWGLISGYNVTYDANGGEGAPEPQNRELGESILVSTVVPTRTGYKFRGWAISKENADNGIISYQPGSELVVKADRTLYAVWTAVETYVVTYDANGGENAPALQVKTSGALLQLSDARPTRVGYTFEGWASSTAAANSGTVEYQPNDIFNKNTEITLYAVWSANSYELAYNITGGTGVFDTQTGTYNTSLAIYDELPVREGYTFVGWGLDSTATLPDYAPGDTFVVPAQNSTLYAIWQKNSYAIIVDSQGGNELPPIIMPYDSSIGEIPEPTKPGYTFSGWADEVPETMPSHDITVTATWTPVRYTVVYSPNAEDVTGTMSDTSHEYDVAQNLPENVYGRPGYIFKGWSVTETGSTVTYTDEQSVVNLSAENNATVILYAVWERIISNITYILDGGENATENPATYSYDDQVKFSPATKYAYLFEGWYTDPEFTQPITGIEKGSVGDVTVYAKFSIEEYDIVYHLNGGINSEKNPDKYMPRYEITFSNPTLTGYEFMGWYTNEILTNSIEKIEIGTTGTIDLYAKWNAIKYPITYHLDGGTNSRDNPLDYTVESDTIVLAPPTKTGYNFAGWRDSDGNTVTEIPAGSTEAISVFADWNLREYTITYVLNGGKNHPDNVPFFHAGDTVAFYPASRDGYTFVGWHQKEDLSDDVIQEFELIDNDLIVYAEWSLTEYHITYHIDTGANSADNPAKYTIEDEITFAPATNEYYEFNGWFYDDNTFTKPVVGVSKGSTGDIDVYAKWTAVEFDITYELNGGTIDRNSPTKITHYESLTLPTPVFPHYRFDGWIDENGNPISKLEGVAESVKVSAQWTPVEYKITYNLNGMYGKGDNPDTYTVEDKFTLNAPLIVPGYEFINWTDEYGNIVTEFDGTIARDIILKANFVDNTGKGDSSIGDSNAGNVNGNTSNNTNGTVKGDDGKGNVDSGDNRNNIVPIVLVLFCSTLVYLLVSLVIGIKRRLKKSVFSK